MTDDFSAISGEQGAYVPCDEVALAVAASDLDSVAVYGEDEGFVSSNAVSGSDVADETDSVAVFGRGTGFVPGPCEEEDCLRWDSFDDRETVTPDWGSTSEDSIPWADVVNVNSGAALNSILASGWVSGGIGYLRSVYVVANGLPCVYVTSGPPIGAADWEVLFRFRILHPVPNDDMAASVAIFRSFGNAGTHVAFVLHPDDLPNILAVAAGNWYLCRFGRDSAGPTYRWKVWLDGVGEPVAWLDTASAGSPVTAFGFVLNAIAVGGSVPPGTPPAELHIDWVDFCEAGD